MSQTLTKPVLLDETGQDIVEKLDEIKEAVSMGTDFVPVMIKVTTPPAKVSYMAGENLNLAGIVVSLIASNGVQIDVTDQCTFVPANGTPLTSANTSVAISYYWYKDDVTFTTNYPIGVKSLSSIAITTAPTLTEYTVGDELDLTGIVVTATYDDGTFLDVTQNCTFSPADGSELSLSDTSVTVTYTEGGVTKTATQAIVVTAPVYGVEWDGTATTSLTRTGNAADFTDPVPYYQGMSGEPSSPFDNIMPWAGMEEVEDADAGLLVKIPKFWYKMTFGEYGDFQKLEISPYEIDGFHVSPAHMDRGDGQGERDFVYVGACFCTSTYKSATQTAQGALTRAQFRTNIHNLGSDIWQWDYAMRTTIQMLYLVEFASWDSQAKIGMGYVSGSNPVASGKNYTYHTGYSNADKTSATGIATYRYIRHAWGGGICYVDGVNVYNRSGWYKLKLSMRKNPSQFSDSGGTLVWEFDNASYAGGYSNYIQDMVQGDCLKVNDGYEYVMCTRCYATNASQSTYITDKYDMYAEGSEMVLATCYDTSTAGGCGLFSIYTKDASFNGSNAVSRLMKLPANS